jgi:predicted O-methyltransferase YrrM
MTTMSFEEIFDCAYRRSLDSTWRKRGASLRLVLSEIERSTPGTPVIVETGTVRAADPSYWAEGNSTIILDHFANHVGATFYSVDIDPDHCALAGRLCSARAQIHCGDSVAFLRDLSVSGLHERIDLLYLDSLDVEWKAPHVSALHALRELEAATPLLRSGSIVLVDDNRKIRGRRSGKGIYVADRMAARNARLLFDGYQMAWQLQG